MSRKTNRVRHDNRGRHKRLRSPEMRKWNRVTNGTRLLKEKTAA